MSMMTSREEQPLRPLISVVVPCFNEKEVLPLIHQGLVKALGSRPDFDLEIVYVDDGSSDSTPEILGDLVRSDQRVVVVPLTRNFGHQAAVTAGLQHASGDAVVIIDADLQDPPEMILTMIESWRGGYEIVYGIRAGRREGWVKRLAYASFYRFMQYLADVEIPLDSGDFALLDRKALDVLNALPEHNRFVRGLRAWIGFRQIGIPYERPRRAAGIPKYNVITLIKLGLDGIFSFSSKPLSMVFWLGIISFTGSMLSFVAYLSWRIVGIEVLGHRPQDVPGFTSIILLLFLLNAIQLISIGVIGQYIGRIYDEAKDRPTYVSRPIKRINRKRDTEPNRVPGSSPLP